MLKPPVNEMTRRELEQELLQLREICRPVNPDYRLEDLTPEDLEAHMSKLLDFLKSCETSDTVGSVLVTFREGGHVQYGATVDRPAVPNVLRQLADYLESNSLGFRLKQELI